MNVYSKPTVCVGENHLRFIMAETEKRRKQFQNLLNDLRKLSELDNAALPTIFRLIRIVYNAYASQSGSKVEQIDSLFTDEGGIEVLMKLLTSVSSDGSGVPTDRLHHMELVVELMLISCKSLKSKHCLQDNGVVKYLIKLLLNEACHKKWLRQESRNLRKFAINLLANLSDEEELKNTLRENRLIELAVHYANVADNPCKLSALEALCRTIDVDKMEVTCRNLDSSFSLLRTLSRICDNGSLQMEQIFYTKESIQKTMRLFSSACTRSNLQEGAIRVDQVIWNVQAELNENIDLVQEKKTKGSLSFKPYEFVFGDIAVRRENQCVQFWPKSEDERVYIPYDISSAFNDGEREIIQQAVREFREKTCVRLVQRTSEADFIFIQALGKTWSFLGRLGGAQSLSLSESGVIHKAKVLHMLMHVLGFHHEHCRSDRDKYIQVKKDNIQNGCQSAFEKYEKQSLDIPYDFKSIMHYSKTKFAKDENKPVIIPLTQTTIGHADCLSDLDIDRIRRLYAGESQPQPPKNKSGTIQTLRRMVKQHNSSPPASCHTQQNHHKKKKWKMFPLKDALRQKRSPKK